MKKYRKKIAIKESIINLVVDNPNYFNLAEEIILKCRVEIESYIIKHPEFLYSLEPINVDGYGIIKEMALAGFKTNTVPMAAVAGAIAEFVVKNIPSKYVVAENGGDIALKGKEVLIGLYAGKSKISGEIAFRIKDKKIYGVCSSSATFGHSISFGNADIVTVFAKSPTLADAAATAICNATVGKDKEEMITKGLEKADDIDGIDGVFISVDDLVGVKGKIPDIIKVNKKISINDLFEVY